LGAVFTLPVCTAPIDQLIRWLVDHQVAVFATRVDAAVPYTDVDFRHRSAIILGSEANGLSAAWKGSWLTPIRLPMQGTVDSLNVSTAAAVLFYEALRQRQQTLSPAVDPQKK
jgi:RNA methyltransferase, TrmH family